MLKTNTQQTFTDSYDNVHVDLNKAVRAEQRIQVLRFIQDYDKSEFNRHIKESKEGIFQSPPIKISNHQVVSLIIDNVEELYGICSRIIAQSRDIEDGMGGVRYVD